MRHTNDAKSSTPNNTRLCKMRRRRLEHRHAVSLDLTAESVCFLLLSRKDAHGTTWNDILTARVHLGSSCSRAGGMEVGPSRARNTFLQDNVCPSRSRSRHLRFCCHCLGLDASSVLATIRVALPPSDGSFVS